MNAFTPLRSQARALRVSRTLQAAQHARNTSVLTSRRSACPTASSSPPTHSHNHHIRRYATDKMSFSNTDTGNKAADPYTDKNLQDASLKEKVDDLVSFVDRCKFCMMTTNTSEGLLASRCMALAGKEGNGVDFIFHANSESGKTDDLEAHPEVNLGFLNSSGEWASISGKATIETDREKVHKHYSPALKAWIGDLGDGKHDGGPDDPRVVLIAIKSKTVQYAISRRTAIGGAIEFAKGVVTGEAPSVHKLRHLNEQELQQARSS